MFDPEISGFLSRYAIVPTNIIFEMVREFQKPENTDKRYMELLYENHCEYEQRIIDKIASLKSLTKIDLNFYTKPINLQLAKNLSFENAVKHSCILLNQDSQGKLIIATDDPFHPERFEFIKEKTGVEYSIVLVIHTQMIKTIELIYGRSVSKQKPIIGTPLPSASNVAKRTKSNVIPSSIQASIVEGEYHGKGVSERTNIYQTDTMPDIRSMSTGESNLPAIYDSETIQLHHHNFDVQKSELWALVKQEPRQLSREPFKEKGGLFNWFDAKVTGTEMNKFVMQLQGALIDINNSTIKAFKGLNEVYETFEALDKEYIASIIVAIRSAQKAAEKAQSASDEALKAQADLNRTIESIKQIVEGNTKFRNNIRAIKHIKDVDQIWLDVQSLISQIKASQTDIQVHLKAINILNSRVNQVETKFKSLEKTANTNEEAQKRKNETFESNINRIISDLREELQTINSLKKELADLTLQYQAIQSIIDKIEHLTDIDQLWESVQHLNVEILNSQSQIQTQITSISDLRNKYDQVVQEIENQTKRIEQLQQVLDNKTTAVETHVQSFSQDVTDIKGVIKKISDSVSSISEVENTEKKKTRMAFVLSGIALFVVIIHLILDILGVL